MKYIDIHSHIQFSQYDEDREAVLSRMRERDIAAIVVGCDLDSSTRASELAKKESDVWATIGVHPTDKRDEGFAVESYSALLHDRVVAVGECGLDYFRKDGRDEIEVARQKKLLQEQMLFALQHNLPLMIHCRPSKGTMDAYDDLLEILNLCKKTYREKLRGNIHFFVGNVRVAKEFIALGFTLSFTGVLTFTRDYDEVVRSVPLTSILSETDCPYVAPVPHRGERNESAFVEEVVKKIAEIRGISQEEVAVALIENTRRTFGISSSSEALGGSRGV